MNTPANRFSGWEAFARLLLSAIFIHRAIIVLLRPETAMSRMMDTGIPVVPVLFVIALSLLLLGSLGLLLGYRTRTCALALVVLTLAESMVVYTPWVEGNLPAFLVRLSVAGGLILVILYGPGRLSFDAQSMVPVRRKRS